MPKKIIALQNKEMLSDDHILAKKIFAALDELKQAPVKQAKEKDLKDLNNLLTIAQRLHYNTISKEALVAHRDGILDDLEQISTILNQTTNELIKNSANSILKGIDSLIPRRRTGLLKVLTIGWLGMPNDESNLLGNVLGAAGSGWFYLKWYKGKQILNAMQDKVNKGATAASLLHEPKYEITPDMKALNELIQIQGTLISNTVSKTEIMKTMQKQSRFGYRDPNNALFTAIDRIKAIKTEALARKDISTANRAEQMLTEFKAQVISQRRTSAWKILGSLLLLPLNSYYYYKWARNRSNLNALAKRCEGA